MDQSRAATEEADQSIGSGKHGARPTFAVVYEANGRAVYRYFLFRLGNAHDAEDLAAATFLKALAAYDLYQDRGRLGAWLFAIARNVLCDHLRRRREHASLDDLAPVLADPAAGPEAVSLRAERQRALGQALRVLPAGQREVLLLRFFAGLSNAEAAAALGRSEAAVKMLVHRGVARMADLCGKEVFEA